MPGKKRTSIPTNLRKCLTEEQDRIFGRVATHLCIPDMSFVHKKAVVNGSLNFMVGNHASTWLVYLAWTAAKLSKTVDTSCLPYRNKRFQAHKAWGINYYRLLELVDGTISASPAYRNKWKGYHSLEVWNEIAMEGKAAHLNAMITPSDGRPKTRRAQLRKAAETILTGKVPETDEQYPLLSDPYKATDRISRERGRKAEAFRNQYLIPYTDSLKDVAGCN